jgi:hypothetical protein
VRDAVEKQHPGHGDAAVAHLRVRAAKATEGMPAPVETPRGPMPGGTPYSRM